MQQEQEEGDCGVCLCVYVPPSFFVWRGVILFLYALLPGFCVSEGRKAPLHLSRLCLLLLLLLPPLHQNGDACVCVRVCICDQGHGDDWAR